MNVYNEFALLVVVAAPVVTVMMINLALMMLGERGTLLLPQLGDPPRTSEAGLSTVLPAPVPAGMAEASAANDEMTRLAA